MFYPDMKFSECAAQGLGKGESKSALRVFPFHNEESYTNTTEGIRQKILSGGKGNRKKNKLKSCETHQYGL